MACLVSMLNSGESLEKALVLTNLALNSNYEFYSRYDKIKIFYCDNLPKKDKTLLTHGTLGGIVENLNLGHIPYQSLNDLWEDRDNILRKIYVDNRISKRFMEKLKGDKKTFDKIACNIPWTIVLEDFRDKLIGKFTKLSPIPIKLEYLNLKKDSEMFFNKVESFNWSSKPYILNPDGSISSKELWKGRCDLGFKKQMEQLSDGIVISPNVYMFLLGASFLSSRINEKIFVGFRNFNRIRRNSYNLAIDILSKNNQYELIVEPKNNSFNGILDKIDNSYKKISLEKKINLGVYECLNRIL